MGWALSLRRGDTAYAPGRAADISCSTRAALHRGGVLCPHFGVVGVGRDDFGEILPEEVRRINACSRLWSDALTCGGTVIPKAVYKAVAADFGLDHGALRLRGGRAFHAIHGAAALAIAAAGAMISADRGPAYVRPA